MDAEQIVREVADRVRELVTEAEERAARIVSDAEAEARRIRERAEAESRERLDAARSALEELQAKLGLAAETTPPPAREPSPAAVPEPQPEADPEPEPPAVPEPSPPPGEATPPNAAGDDREGSPRGSSDDQAAARLVAMNMALEGAAREEIEARLAESYELEDAASLVDDVLALASK